MLTPSDAYGKYINDSTLLIVAGNPTDSASCSKIKIRPLIVKGERMLQVTRTVGAKELHENLDYEKTRELLNIITGNEFRQIEIKTDSTSVVIMISKKGTTTVKCHPVKTQNPSGISGNNSNIKNATDNSEKNTGKNTNKFPLTGIPAASELSHNKKKNYLLEEGIPVPFLVELGVQTKSGKIINQKYDKFRQINRYLEFVDDIVDKLPTGREISIIDFGCGKSYLTFALYHYLHELKGLDVRITGLDLKEDVIAHCNQLAKEFGYEKLSFLHGDIADYTGTDSVDMVVTLHACDTATDYALYKAITWGARVIFCVPCCQHEINKQIKCDELSELLRYGLIKERMSALITDTLRASMLEEQGYRTQILEFIDMEHTPKNILIRAVRQPLKVKSSDRCSEIMQKLNIEPTLHKLLSFKS